MNAQLGVGYDQINALVANNMATHDVVTLLFVKTVVWVIALGSGTSGGILAPVLIIVRALAICFVIMIRAAVLAFWRA